MGVTYVYGPIKRKRERERRGRERERKKRERERERMKREKENRLPDEFKSECKRSQISLAEKKILVRKIPLN